MVPHFLFFDQLTAFMGSFGPSQSTTLGSLTSACCVDFPFSNSTFSISLAYWSSLGFVSEIGVFESPFSPLKAGLDAADRKEVEDDGRSDRCPPVASGVTAISCSLSCASEVRFVDELFWSCEEPVTKREHPNISRSSIVRMVIRDDGEANRIVRNQPTYRWCLPSLLVLQTATGSLQYHGRIYFLCREQNPL